MWFTTLVIVLCAAALEVAVIAKDINSECRDCLQHSFTSSPSPLIENSVFIQFLSHPMSFPQFLCINNSDVNIFAKSNIIIDVKCIVQECMNIRDINSVVGTIFRGELFCTRSEFSLSHEFQCNKVGDKTVNTHKFIVEIIRNYLEIMILSLILSVVIIKKSFLKKCVFETFSRNVNNNNTSLNNV